MLPRMANVAAMMKGCRCGSCDGSWVGKYVSMKRVALGDARVSVSRLGSENRDVTTPAVSLAASLPLNSQDGAAGAVDAM